MPVFVILVLELDSIRLELLWHLLPPGGLLRALWLSRLLSAWIPVLNTTCTVIGLGCGQADTSQMGPHKDARAKALTW